MLPVVGTTYMASDVHRKFLFEPNPHVWDRDFAYMKRQGINMVRTGLWTAWTRVMLDPGAVDENVLSALDAYVLSAAKNGILVCFNFFAFLPPAYGDTNPYLGPRALEGQRALLTMVARRYRGVGWVHWDLINEPSYAPPEGVWSNLPIGDEHEAPRVARVGEGEARRRPARPARPLARPTRTTCSASPAPRRSATASSARTGGRARCATSSSSPRWRRRAGRPRLRDVLKAAGGDVLVTLGQDEGGTGTRPAQLLHADSVDYTSVHTWWRNDDLLWDGVMTKALGRPNMHQETGLMSLHDPDGAPWRTPAAAADLLDRKFAYAFAGRGAGVIQWAWNVNPYQPIDNEATIGFNRPDGTAKLEMDAVARFASFFEQAAPFLDDFAPEPVALVVPYARLFSGRPGGIDHTKRIVRLLAERHGVVPQALPDIRLTAGQLRGVKLAIVPAPEMLDEDAARALLEASKAGTKVLVTGHVEGDSYGRATPSLQALGVLGEGRPVALHETTGWGATAGKTRVGHVREPRPALAAAGDEGLPGRARRQRLARAAAARLRPRDGAARRAPRRGAEGGRRRHSPGRRTASRPGFSSRRRRCSWSASTRRRRRPGGGSSSRAGRSRSRSRPSAPGWSSSRGAREGVAATRARGWTMSTGSASARGRVTPGPDRRVPRRLRRVLVRDDASRAGRRVHAERGVARAGGVGDGGGAAGRRRRGGAAADEPGRARGQGPRRLGRPDDRRGLRGADGVPVEREDQRGAS